MSAQITFPPPPQPPQSQTLDPGKHGNWAQWASALSAGVALIGLFANIGLTLYFHFSAGQMQASDDHVNGLIRSQLDPAVKDISGHIEKTKDELSRKLDDLSDKLWRLSRRQRQQGAALELQSDPILNNIRATIVSAQQSGESIPDSKFWNLKLAIHGLPATDPDYWGTVADIINYQSSVDQKNGRVPDPAKISSRCTVGVPTGAMENCKVELGSGEEWTDTVFSHCVVHYRGGKPKLTNVRFVKCRFVLDLPPEQPPNASRDRFLTALLDSRTLTQVQLSLPS